MAVWIALLVFLAALVGGIAYATLRALALWRTLKRTGRAFGDEATRISDASARIQEHLDRAQGASDRLAQASSRLSRSRAQLEVQLGALREARHTVRRALWFLPGA